MPRRNLSGGPPVRALLLSTTSCRPVRLIPPSASESLSGICKKKISCDGKRIPTFRPDPYNGVVICYPPRIPAGPARAARLYAVLLPIFLALTGEQIFLRNLFFS